MKSVLSPPNVVASGTTGTQVPRDVFAGKPLAEPEARSFDDLERAARAGQR